MPALPSSGSGLFNTLLYPFRLLKGIYNDIQSYLQKRKLRKEAQKLMKTLSDSTSLSEVELQNNPEACQTFIEIMTQLRGDQLPLGSEIRDNLWRACVQDHIIRKQVEEGKYVHSPTHYTIIMTKLPETQMAIINSIQTLRGQGISASSLYQIMAVLNPKEGILSIFLPKLIILVQQLKNAKLDIEWLTDPKLSYQDKLDLGQAKLEFYKKNQDFSQLDDPSMREKFFSVLRLEAREHPADSNPALRAAEKLIQEKVGVQHPLLARGELFTPSGGPSAVPPAPTPQISVDDKPSSSSTHRKPDKAF